MAYLTTWNITDLPSEMIDILEKDIEQFDDWLDDSKVMGNEVVPRIRNSKNAWIIYRRQIEKIFYMIYMI